MNEEEIVDKIKDIAKNRIDEHEFIIKGCFSRPLDDQCGCMGFRINPKGGYSFCNQPISNCFELEPKDEYKEKYELGNEPWVIGGGHLVSMVGDESVREFLKNIEDNERYEEMVIFDRIVKNSKKYDGLYSTQSDRRYAKASTKILKTMSDARRARAKRNYAKTPTSLETLEHSAESKRFNNRIGKEQEERLKIHAKTWEDKLIEINNILGKE